MTALGAALLAAAAGAQDGDDRALRARVSWGYRAPAGDRLVRIVPTTGGAAAAEQKGWNLEPGEGIKDGAWRTRAGGGDVDGVDFILKWPGTPEKPPRKEHSIWSHLLRQTDPETAARIRKDPAFRPQMALLSLETNAEGTRGFAVDADQLAREGAMWLPELDVFAAAGDPPPEFEDHQKMLSNRKGKRVLDRVIEEPEASCEQFRRLWADMGDPRNPHPAHVVGITWDGAIPKFGIERDGTVRSDLGNPDAFRFGFDAEGLAWKGQRLTDGLPVIVTTFENETARWEIEQFAYPLDGPPAGRKGDIPMVLLQKLRVAGRAGAARAGFFHQRDFPPGAEVVADDRGGKAVFRERSSGRVVLVVEGAGPVQSADAEGSRDARKKTVSRKLTGSFPVAAGGTEVVVKLPSPPVEAKDEAKLLGLSYGTARAGTLKFWSDWLARGARFRSPEAAVNELFRANLWHALRLPRRHGGEGEGAKMDIPYSNFAYDQKGIPWPVNQAVYVDYMIYDLRGYHAVSAEELLAIYRTNQGPSGRVGGYANWGVYTPGMLYAAAWNYLLSRDGKALERLLPPTNKAMEWCIAEARRATEGGGRGLVRAPLNDLTSAPGEWAFNQAYFQAGLALWGRVLKEIGHQKAGECLGAAERLRAAIEREFGRASTRAPAVQLRDGTWVPYVPSDASQPRRLVEQWYPTDVDTGALHLARLRALDPAGPLATFLLHDHEDNLFMGGLGMANEPVYNQQASVYLWRDEPKAAIRAFYGMMACAFSHTVMEPVEHRWGWGQYFGPPSTDGAWFELYRNMLVQERDGGTLLIGQAVPRAWLEDGKKVEVERAPTWFGPVSFTLESRADSGRIAARVDFLGPARPSELVVRLRHPKGLRMKSAQVEGASWKEFEPDREWIRIGRPGRASYRIAAEY